MSQLTNILEWLYVSAGVVLEWSYVIAGVVLLFGAAVFVHEFGHYWMARRRGLKVEAFAIGFGPKIYGWTKDGIEYSWRWIPAGGYVKLPQMVTSEALEGGKDGAAEPLPPASPWSKILVAFAGPFMNIVFAFVIATVIYFVGLPILVNPSIVGYVDPESDEAKLGIQVGDRIVEVNGEKVDSWQGVQMTTVLARTNVIPVVVERDGSRYTYQLAAKVNPVVGWKMLNLDPRDHPKIIEVMDERAAFTAGLEAGDVVFSFAGVPIASREQFIGLIQKRGGVETDIVVERNDAKVSLTITPKNDPNTNTGLIGVMLGSSTDTVYRVQKPGPSPWFQIKDVLDKTYRTLSALFHSEETGIGVKDLSGPVGILTMLGAQVKTDIRLALSFLVLLNINLAIINLFPIPVLDGGHILMAGFEWIWRRPLGVRFVEWTTTAFAVLLISFMLYVTYHDVTTRFGLFKSMFHGETTVESAPSESGQGVTPSDVKE